MSIRTTYVFALIAALVVIIAASSATSIIANYTPLKWNDCGSALTSVWGVSITPMPQYLGQPWTIHYVFLPYVNLTGDMNIVANIDVSFKGLPIHNMKINLCNTTNPIAKGDGFDLCPYAQGVPAVFHDTNTVPKFVPFKGPFLSRVSMTNSEFDGKNGKFIMCFEYNQTYGQN